MAAKKKLKYAKSFDESLLDTANKLHSSIKSSEYKHVVLSLICPKLISDTLEQHQAALTKAYQQDYIYIVEFYTMENVFYQPKIQHGSYIRPLVKQDDIALKEVNFHLKAA